MNITTNAVVSMHYTLKNDAGATIDTSEGKDPLSFIFGSGMIIPGLERELEGKSTGDSLDVVIQPEDGYGTYNAEAVGEVQKELFQGDMELTVGMPVQAQNPDGSVQVFTIREIQDDTVILDGNHPLAGQVLFFNVEITDVREATKEELEHGHVH